MKDQEYFETILELFPQIIRMFDENQSVTLHPSKKVRDTFQSIVDKSYTEINRRKEAGKAGGRPRLPDDQLTSAARSMRRIREKRWAEQKEAKKP